MKIQKIEIEDGAAIYCIFCGQRIVSMDDEDFEDGTNITPCLHTLFVCHDEGFEYRSSAFDEAMGISGVDDNDIETPDETGRDGYTDQLEMPYAIKIASYAGAPSGFGFYVGLANRS